MIAFAQAVALVLVAPLVHGTMRTVRARLQGRPGPSPLQPYRDLLRLWSKEALLPDGASGIALCAPGIVLGIALTFAAAVPLVTGGALDAVVDVVGLALLLALGRFVLTLAALDGSSAFAGMAASREVTFGSLVEPALMVVLIGAAVAGHGPRLSALPMVPFDPAQTLAFAALFLLLLAETARVPIDNQETHYELTMIHEGLVLEYGGWQLAMLHAASAVRQLSFLVLAASLLPGGGPMHVVWVAAVAAAITLVETAFAKVRLFEVPHILVTALVLALASVGVRIAGGLG